MCMRMDLRMVTEKDQVDVSESIGAGIVGAARMVNDLGTPRGTTPPTRTRHTPVIMSCAAQTFRPCGSQCPCVSCNVGCIRGPRDDGEDADDGVPDFLVDHTYLLRADAAMGIRVRMREQTTKLSIASRLVQEQYLQGQEECGFGIVKLAEV